MAKITNILLVLSNLLGTIFCGISAYFGAAIYYGWKPAGNTSLAVGAQPGTIGTGASSMNPHWPLIIFGGLGIALLASNWIFISKVLGKSILPQASNLLVHAPVLPPTHELAKSKKFYSERNKSDLANALTDLSEIVNRHHIDITDKAQYIPNIWNMQSDRISPQDINNLIIKMNDITELAEKYHQQIYGESGIMLDI